MRPPMAIKEFDVARINVSVKSKEKEPNYPRSRRRWLYLLLVTFFATLVMAVAGIALAALSLLHLIASGGPISTLGVVLIAMTFVTLIFSAHCLDRIDDADHAIDMSAYKHHVLGQACRDCQE